MNETDKQEEKLPQAPLEIDFLESYDRPALIAELLRIVGVLGKSTLSIADVNHYGRMSADCVMKKFGSMHAALTANRNLSIAQLLKLLADLWAQTLKDHRRRPQAVDFNRYALPVTQATY